MTGLGPLHPGPGPASGGSTGGAPIPAHTAETVRRCGNYDCRCCSTWEAEVGRWQDMLRSVLDAPESERLANMLRAANALDIDGNGPHQPPEQPYTDEQVATYMEQQHNDGDADAR